MAHTKFPCCILNQAAMAMTVSVHIYVHARAKGAIFSLVQHWMNISISWQLTACLSSTPQPRTDLQQHNYYYPAIPILSYIHPYISIASLTLYLFSTVPPSTSPSLFAQPLSLIADATGCLHAR